MSPGVFDFSTFVDKSLTVLQLEEGHDEEVDCSPEGSILQGDSQGRHGLMPLLLV
jgi:hypothetical protein